jgi:hypothetical protein
MRDIPNVWSIPYIVPQQEAMAVGTFDERCAPQRYLVRDKRRAEDSIVFTENCPGQTIKMASCHIANSGKPA